MKKILRSDEIKPNFEELKERWTHLLGRFYLDKNTLDAAHTVGVFCPFCGSSDIVKSFLLNGFRHNTCSQCNTLYVSPRLTDSCMAELYRDEYYNEVFVRTMLPVFEKRKKLIGCSKFEQTISRWGGNAPGSVLDIGAGVGEVLDVFRDEGWCTNAIEMNSVGVEWLRTRGHDQVFHGMLDEYKTTAKFDIVMAWGVVEHVVNPDDFLDKVRSLLVPGGLFVSEVPHGQCLLVDMVEKIGMDPKRILIGEQHIVLYSTDAYRDLHERNGFELEHLQTNGLDCDTIFKEQKINVPDDLLAAMQACVDEQLYGDLLRGFWRCP